MMKLLSFAVVTAKTIGVFLASFLVSGAWIGRQLGETCSEEDASFVAIGGLAISTAATTLYVGQKFKRARRARRQLAHSGS